MSVSDQVCWGTIIVRNTFKKMNRKNKMMQICSVQSGDECQIFWKSLKSAQHSLQNDWCLLMWLAVRNGKFSHQEDWNLEACFFFLGPFSYIFSDKASRADWLYGGADESVQVRWQVMHGLPGRVFFLWVGMPGTMTHILQSGHITYWVYHCKIVRLVGEMTNWEHSRRNG